MKNSVFLISFLLFIIGISTLQAHPKEPKKNNYLVISKNINQLAPVLLTSTALAREDGDKYGKFYMVICGKTVSDIPGNMQFNKLMEEAAEQNVQVFICGISLKAFQISPDQLPKQVKITDNGILYGFQLTKKGFITITI
ncbi:DsrE family protein [Dyadobacter tibetensis]|uniref:DsrE family protein n=1 Tax=Dyadobacter tibetensis TaxID=1211851 RepID=UPI0004707AFA|nr:DsrE family protein [Dyadobacter tibetensis]